MRRDAAVRASAVSLETREGRACMKPEEEEEKHANLSLFFIATL